MQVLQNRNSWDTVYVWHHLINITLLTQGVTSLIVIWYNKEQPNNTCDTIIYKITAKREERVVSGSHRGDSGYSAKDRRDEFDIVFKGQTAGAVDGGKNTANRAALNITMLQLKGIWLYLLSSDTQATFWPKSFCRLSKISVPAWTVKGQHLMQDLGAVTSSTGFLPLQKGLNDLLCISASCPLVHPSVLWPPQHWSTFHNHVFFHSFLSACVTLWSSRTRLSLWCGAVHHCACLIR